MTFKVTKVPLTDPYSGYIEDLHDASFPGCEPYLESRGDYWLVRDGDRYAGFAAMMCSGTEKVGYLARSGVLKPWQGQGLQRKLIKVRVAWARKRRLRVLVTETIDNPVSANNLIEEGFRMYRPAAPWNDYADEVCYWRLEL